LAAARAPLACRVGATPAYRAREFEPAVEKCQKADRAYPSNTPHDLRYTAASLAVSAGADVKAVERMPGHAKASLTLDVYADLFGDDLDVVADKLDAAIRWRSCSRLACRLAGSLAACQETPPPGQRW